MVWYGGGDSETIFMWQGDARLVLGGAEHPTVVTLRDDDPRVEYVAARKGHQHPALFPEDFIGNLRGLCGR